MNLATLFADITPIPQDDGPHPVCAIDYPAKYVEAMNYLRALIDVDEHSERALQLTALCLRFNPANYTIWWYRRKCLSTLSNQDDKLLNDSDDNTNDYDDHDSLDGSEKGKGSETAADTQTQAQSQAQSQTQAQTQTQTNENNVEKSTYYNLQRIKFDLHLASELGGSNPKNYQIWYHRRSLLEYRFQNINDDEHHEYREDDKDDIQNSDDEKGDERVVDKVEEDYAREQLKQKQEGGNGESDEDDCGDDKSHHDEGQDTESGIQLAKDELKYIASVLDEDGKNYHAWSHRQWIINTVNNESIWEKEVQFTNELIEDDIRNNSAWNERWFATHFGKKVPLSIAKAQSESDYSIEIISQDPYNESPLRYLVALVREQYKLVKHNGLTSADAVASEEVNVDDDYAGEENERLFQSFLDNVAGEIDKVKEDLDCGNDCPSLIAAFIDILELKGDSMSLFKAAGMANDLATNFDVVRKKYWLMRERMLRSLIDK